MSVPGILIDLPRISSIYCIVHPDSHCPGWEGGEVKMLKENISPDYGANEKEKNASRLYQCFQTPCNISTTPKFKKILWCLVPCHLVQVCISLVSHSLQTHWKRRPQQTQIEASIMNINILIVKLSMSFEKVFVPGELSVKVCHCCKDITILNW